MDIRSAGIVALRSVGGATGTRVPAWCPKRLRVPPMRHLKFGGSGSRARQFSGGGEIVMPRRGNWRGGRRGGSTDLEEEGEDIEVGADADEADEDGEEECEGI